MGTLNAIYVRASDAKMVKSILASFPEAYSDRQTQFFAIERAERDFQCPEIELRDLATKLQTDVIWLSFQSTVDAFQFFHWRSTDHLRTLIYGCNDERLWERIEGDPEFWERQAIFDLTNLADTLDCYDDLDERREVERIYLARILSPSHFHPMLDARETARAVATFYRLPGWSLEEDDSPLFRSSLE